MNKSAQQMVLAFFLAASMIFSLRALAAATPPTEGQIMGLMKEANEAEIKAAKRAEDKATNAEVKAFAVHMIEQHKMNMKDGKAVAKDQKIKTQKSALSEALEADAKAKYKELKAQKGADFDRMYMNQQIAMHEKLLGELDQNLIPAASNPKLKEFLGTTREHVQEHLTRARSVQSSLQ